MWTILSHLMIAFVAVIMYSLLVGGRNENDSLDSACACPLRRQCVFLRWHQRQYCMERIGHSDELQDLEQEAGNGRIVTESHGHGNIIHFPQNQDRPSRDTRRGM